MHRFCSLLLISALFASCKNASDQSSEGLKDDTIPVKLLALTQQASVQQIKTSGIFTTDNEVVVSFKNGGVVSKVYVKEGDAVNAGQLLASLNPTEVEANVSQAKLSAEKAKRDFERAAALFKDSVATLEQLQNAETALRIAQEQLRAANYNQSQTEIRATSSGYVLKRFVNDGQVVGPGTAVLQLNRTGESTWQLKVGVSDQQWASIALGDSATVSSDVLGSKISALVYKKSEGIDPASGVFTVMLKLAPGDYSKKIGTGMFAQAVIHAKQSRSYWQIPFDALLDGDAGKAFVFVTNDKKTAKQVEVKVDAIQQHDVLISEGLEDAQSLIISGSAYLTDGSPIKVVE
ncbi:efflux RND transporter periplasmic adaptor subunit [Olivibacter sp. XZL3]|uniref:efflux RND transporter periplasmic adaptor subunit n=1 Tax=Olivibacter sp. XZL3 TaxID=1735116 RepID=UPI00106497CF|nr:efflux RND transporter periplasmic adaptor subunit [Olivibacter sp. XZL3]